MDSEHLDKTLGFLQQGCRSTEHVDNYKAFKAMRDAVHPGPLSIQVTFGRSVNAVENKLAGLRLLAADKRV